MIQAFGLSSLMRQHDFPLGSSTPRARRGRRRMTDYRGDALITTCSLAFGLSRPLRYPVPTGTQLTGGVHRLSGDVPVVLHSSNSLEIPSDFGTSWKANKLSGSICASAGDTDAV